MAKRKETIDLENALIKDTREKRIYGCEEITIGFYNNGHGNEIVDFMTMDSKGIVKCYELKVTLQDLKSSAKKSWYGNYNYLVVSKTLYDTVEDWNIYVPKHVGIIVGTSLSIVKKPTKKNIDNDTEIMLKESFVRSMYWKMIKYIDAQSLDNLKKLNAKIKKLEQERDKYYKDSLYYEKIIYGYQKYKALNDNLEDVNLEAMAKEEREKYRKTRQLTSVVN